MTKGGVENVIKLELTTRYKVGEICRYTHKKEGGTGPFIRDNTDIRHNSILQQNKDNMSACVTNI